MDKRWKELGKLLVNYSTSVQPKERVMIAMTEVETYPLVQAVYEACVQAGAHPQVQFLSEKLNRSLLKYGSDQQIEWVPEIEAYGMEWADVYIGLRGAHNLKVFWDIPSPKLAQLRRSMGKISTLRWEKTRWCLVRVPNASLAQEAEMDEETITDMFFSACLLDWSEISEKWNRWATLLSQGSEIRILGYKTDLHFSVKGRSWQVANGKINMPDGEIMTSPDDSTVEGEIYFKFPGVLGGRLMYDVHLQWQKGELVKATSSTHQDFLQSTIQSDPGASRIGEFAFGTNPEVKYFCKDILLDEKIGGTIHIALGRAYPETGGTNKSAIHWDIVKDMRKEGEVYLDGNLIFQKGKMLI
jgi:aminopeptidase